MNKEMQNYLNKGIMDFSLMKPKCDIQLCGDGHYFYIVKSCDNHFTDASMSDLFSTNDFKKACEFISKNAKNYDAIMCFGYNINENFNN